MTLLTVNWRQERPTRQDAQRMASEVSLTPVAARGEAVERTLARLREVHSNGGAFLAGVRIGESEVFDWFASRNRLLEEDILSLLLRRRELRDLVPEVDVPQSLPDEEAQGEACLLSSHGFRMVTSFSFDGELAARLFGGGAYAHETKMTGVAAMQLASEFSEAVFGRRYEELAIFSSYEAWTPWFYGIAWDWTSVVFDKRERTLWVLFITDTD